MVAMTDIFWISGTAAAGFRGLLLAIVFSVGTNVFAWYNSDKMALRMY